MRFEPGRLVLRRHFMRGEQLARVWLGRVAAEDEHGLWLWIPDGSPWADIGAADGRRFRDVPFAEWGRTPAALRLTRWRGDVLMLHPVEGDYSLWFLFGPSGDFRSWYVNLELPVIRWDDGGLGGIDTVDHDLDLVVEPDRSWRWKDEEEFRGHLAYPDVYWVGDEAAVRAEGERMVRLIETGEFPFDGTRCDFRPDPSWTWPAELPCGWDRARQTPSTNTAMPDTVDRVAR